MSSERKLVHENPTITVDIYFATNNVFDWAGNAGLGIIGKCFRNRLPKYIEPLYLHK